MDVFYSAQRETGEKTEEPSYFEIKNEVRKEILALAELSYQQFSSKLLPGTERIAGVRLPLLRKLAKQMIKRNNWQRYLQEIFHEEENPVKEESASTYGSGRKALYDNEAEETAGELFEEIMFQGIIIGYAPLTLEERFFYLDKFIPKIDNWSVCDSVCATMKFALEYPQETWDFLQKHVQGREEYGIRFAVVMYINYFLNEEYLDRVLAVLDEIDHPGYYVKMAVAWAVSMCYVVNAKKTENFLQKCSLDDFTYNKAIQKMIESRQVTAGEKEKLKGWKRSTLCTAKGREKF